MQQYHNILIASDLSPLSKQLIDRAKLLKANKDSSISIIHALHHSALAYGGEFSLPIDLELQQKIELMAQERLAHLTKNSDIPLKNQIITHGSIKNGVCQYAKDNNIDLILVGSHHHDAFGAIIGSQAHAILQSAPCDTLIIKFSNP